MAYKGRRLPKTVGPRTRKTRISKEVLDDKLNEYFNTLGRVPDRVHVYKQDLPHAQDLKRMNDWPCEFVPYED